MFASIQKPRNQKLLVAVLAAAIWLLYAFLGPGSEFFNAYRLLVLSPESLSSVFHHPLTYNPPWLAPLLSPFITMPGRSGYLLFMAVTILLFWLSARELNGKMPFILLSSQLFWILWWGQIEGFVVFGIALAWSALQRQSWQRMLLAMLLVALKPQMGIFPLLYIWWSSGKDRWKSLAGFIIIIISSVLIYGPWPLWFIESVLRISNETQYQPWNASMGLLALPLLVPALRLQLNPYQRTVALTATGLLISPYMPYYSTIPLLCFTLPVWSSLFAFLGFLSPLLGTKIAWNGMVFFPLCVLLWLYWPYLQAVLLSRTRSTQKNTL